MLLKNLKQNMILPKKEIFINKIVNIRGIDVHLISITMEEHRNVLWAMYRLNEEIDLEESIEYTSNRDKMINNISEKMNLPNIHISEIIIQKQKMTFSSSSAGPIHQMNYEGYMQLQHFIENGMITTNWDKVNLKHIVIAGYEQEKTEEFPIIDSSKELEVTLKVSEEFEDVLINQPLRLEFDKIEKDDKFYFYDSIEKKNRIFYIDRIKHYDIWEEVNDKFEDAFIQDFSKEQIKKMKEQYIDILEKICPKGMDLAIVEYETEDDIQLNFYSKEYLDARPVCNTSSPSAIILKSDKEVGNNGFKNRVCIIKPIEKDFNGSLDVELFSWVMKIPEEIITL